MSADKVYMDGDIVWVKLGNNWWPGEVTGSNRHPEGLIKHLKRVPYCVVKFFNENSYEYVRSAKQIFPFQCAKKEEFLRKGYSLYNSGNSFMEKFPEDVEVAERLTRRKEPSLIINDRPDSIVKAILGQPLITTYDDCYDGSNYQEKRRSGDSVTKILNITQNRNNENSNDKLGISSISILTRPNLNASSNLPLNNTKNVTNNVVNNSTNYQCNLCDFTSVRQNVMILHRKMHSNRNSIGSTTSTKLSSKPSPAPPPASAAVGTAGSTTSTTSVNINKLNQNQIVSDDKNINKTKVSTITTIATKTMSDKETREATIDATIRTSTSKEPIDTSKLPITKAIKPKSPKLTKKERKSNKESKVQSAYATILSDFCPNETEICPASDDKQSRRSLRHQKNSDELTTVDITNGSSICIDISETRSIQKVPKKRDFSLLQLRKDSQTESSDPDVYIVDKDKETTAKNTSAEIITSAESLKNDVEDLRKILLADWSDDDETPPDAIVVEDSIVINEPNTSAVVLATCTPLLSSSSLLTGRIRNIPKKDRRDVVLQDFNSDISFIESDNKAGESRKPMAVDLDSSNSSIVEIIEDDQSAAPIITINDDEEDADVTKAQKDQNTVIVCESRDNDSAEEEDEQESSAPTISHFKKKYLSGEKLQNQASSVDDMDDESVVKNRAEIAESDQKLTAEIESLLAQTQPTVTDLLNANSLEESIAVKDLPIKERGKRIFKSRNKSRIEEKTTTEANTATTTVTVVHDNIKTIEQNKPDEYSHLEIIINKENETNESTQIESKLDTEVILEVDENLTSKNTATEISNQEILYNTSADASYLPNEPLTANENKENEDISKGDNNSIIHTEKGQLDKEKLVDSEEKPLEKEITSEEIIKAIPEESQIMDLSEKLSNEITNETMAEPNEGDETNIPKIQENLDENVEEVKIDKHLNNMDENKIISDIELDSFDKTEATKITETEQKNTSHNGVEVTESGNLNSLSTEESKIEIICDNVTTSLPNDEIIPELNIADEINRDISENENSENLYKIRVKSSEKLFEQTFNSEPDKVQETLTVTEVSNVDTRLITTTPTDENSSMGASDTGAEFGSPTSMLSEERLPAFRFESNQTPQQEIDLAENELQIENPNQTTDQETNYNPKTNTKELFNDISFSSVNFTENSMCSHNPLIQRRFSMNLHSIQSEASPIKRPRFSVDDIRIKNNMEMAIGRSSSTSLLQFKSEVNNRPKSRHMKITPRRNVSELFKRETKGNGNDKNEITECISSIQDSIEKIQETEKELNTGSLTEICEENYNSENNNENAEGQTLTIETVTKTNEDKVTPTDENVASEEKRINENVPEHEVNQQEDNMKENILATGGKVNEELNDESQSDKAVHSQSSCLISKVSAEDLPPEIIATTETQNIVEPINHLSNISNSIPENDLIKTDLKEKDDGTDDVHCPHNKESQKEDLSQVVNSEVPFNENVHITVNNAESVEINIPTTNVGFSLDKVETLFSPDVPPPTPQEREVVIECENANQTINDPQQLQEKGEEKIEICATSTTPPINNQANEGHIQPETPNETNLAAEVESSPPTLDMAKRLVEDSDKEPVNECENKIESISQQPEDIITKNNHANVLPSSPLRKNDCDESENQILNLSIPQIKDFIIECEPQTPQGIIECDHNTPTQITPEKEVIIDSEMASVIPEKDITIEENIQIEEKESLIEREFQEIPEESNVQQEPQATVLQTDADKAAEEFLIEFDSIVNHSHSVKEGTPNSSMEEAINAEDLINNIIEEVHEDHQLKQDIPRDKSPISLQYEANATYTVVTPKTSWNQIFKESFTKQSTPAKRRQTICFEISDTKEGVACKKQALDFESILPANRTLKRTAERKLTLPAIETKPSNNKQQHGIFALNHNQLTLNKKLLPTTMRKLSIEDNITSFIIERPKQLQQQSQQSTSGPPPLQRIRSLNHHGHTTVVTNEDNITEPPPLQSHDNLYQELFHPIPSSPTPCVESSQRPEGARVIHQQIFNSPAVTSIPTKTSTDSKISKNKQIGIDSRGNKYVIIKTPPTDIVVQSTLTSSPAAAVTTTNNFGTAITIQPLPRNSVETTATKSTKNKTSLTSSSSRKQQQPQMNQISITVPAKSPIQIGKSSDIINKTPSRNRRKTTQTKALPTPAATTNTNVNSAKHKQAMEALSRRLSIASEAPPLAKISRTSTTHVQTQLSNSSNLTTFFGDTQISNIAQQQLIHLQQQQQQPVTSPLPPPIILNKNAHQQSVMHRKPRKIAQHQKNIQQQQNFQQQQNVAKSSQLLQLQQQQTQMQQQQLQQQFITQITAQQPQQQHNLLQPPPLQQIQPQAVQMQQQQQQIVQQTDGIIITTTATEDDNVIDSNTQLIALPTQPYPGYSETFLLCKVKGNTCKPVDNVPLYLNHQLNELVPVPLEALEGGPKPPQDHQIEIKSSNTPQQILTGAQNNALLHDTENNLQMANISCGVTDGEILTTAGIEAEHNHQQHSQNQAQQQIMEECVVEENTANTGNNQMADFSGNQDVNSELTPNNGILLNIEGQQVLLDAATFAHLLANPDANTQLISDDGTEYVLTREVLAALQMQQEQQQALELANAAAAEQQQHPHPHLEQSGGNDIIAVALAGSDLYDNDVLTIDTSQGMQLIDGDGSIVFPQQTVAITQQHLTPPAVVTNAVLDQSPIMSTLEVPSSIAMNHKLQGSQLITVPSHHLAASSNAALGGRSNLEDSLAAIGVTTQSSSVPSSLGLPITVTNPNIASKVTSAGSLNEMLQFVSHRPATAAATAAAVAAAALAGESRIFTD